MTHEEQRRAISPLATVALGLLAATAPLSLDAYLPALPAIAVELGVSAQSVQLSLTACLLGLGLGQLLAGPIGDRFGRRIPMMLGAALYTAASLGCAFASTAETLILLRLAQGLSGAVGIVLSRAIVQDIATGRVAARLYSQMAAVSGAAPVLAPVAGAVVIAGFGWRAVFVALAALGLLMLAAVVLILKETHPAARRTTGSLRLALRSFLDLLRMRTFRGYLGILVSSAALLFSYISTAPFVLQGVFEFSELEFAATFGAVGLGLLLTSLATARLLRRRHPWSVIRSAQLVQLAGVLLLALVIFIDVGTGWSHPVLLVASLAVAVVPCGAIGPCCTALAMAESGQRAGSASALLGVGMFLAGGLVSPLSGNGHPAIIMVALMLIAVVTGLMLGSLTARRR